MQAAPAVNGNNLPGDVRSLLCQEAYGPGNILCGPDLLQGYAIENRLLSNSTTSVWVPFVTLTLKSWIFAAGSMLE